MTTAVLESSPRTWRRPSSRASIAALRAWMPPVSALRPLALARGNVLRVRNGANTVVHVRVGIVWITEERSRRDAIVRQGESHVIVLDGLTVVHADRDARIVLEFRGESAARACVELAAGYGEPGRALASHRCPSSFAERVALAAGRVRRALRSVLAALEPQARWHRDEDALRRDAHSPEAVRHRLLHAAGEPHPYY
jgi:hypothetical protein